MSTTTKLSTVLALGTLLSAPAAALAEATTWQIDTGHSTAQFKVRHLMVSNVRGELGPVQGTIQLDEADVTRSRVDVKIDARKIDTKDAKRDEHLRSADFLDVEKHPFVTFTSTQVKRAASGALDVVGELTVRGVKRPVTLRVDALPAAVRDPWGNTQRGAPARASLNRKDFGLVWNMALETGGLVVGETVDIELEVELVKQAPKS